MQLLDRVNPMQIAKLALAAAVLVSLVASVAFVLRFASVGGVFVSVAVALLACGVAMATRGIARRMEMVSDRLGATTSRLSGVTDRVAAAAEGVKALKESAQATSQRLDEVARYGEATRNHVAEVRQQARAEGRERRGEDHLRFDRALSEEDIEALTQTWPKLLGIEASAGHVRYLQRKAIEVEGTCDGRAAATVRDLILRALAARAARGSTLEVLEIGVLFGVGSVFLHVANRPFFERVRLHLLDPLEGYYGAGHIDPVVGLPVTRATVERNLARWGVPGDDVTMLQGLSTDAAIVAAASRQRYGVVIIDGDHGYDGVRRDFELYAELVAPGGYVLFDDYGNDDWPDVGRYVDETVRQDERFAFVGAAWHTAVFQRVPVDAAVGSDVASPARSVAS